MSEETKKTKKTPVNKVEPVPEVPRPPRKPSGSPYSLKPFAILGVIAIFAVGGTILFSLFFAKPTKQDFEEASNAVKSVDTAYKAMSERAGAMFRAMQPQLNSKGSSTVISEEFASTLDSYRKESGTLERLKAFRDKDLKVKLEAFMQKNDKTITYLEGLVASLQDYQLVMQNCVVTQPLEVLFTQDKKTTFAKYIKTDTVCMNALSKLKKAKNKSFAQFAEKLEPVMKQLRKSLEKIVDDAEKTERSFRNLPVRDLLKVNRERSSIVSAFTKEARQEAKEAVIEDDIKELQRAVDDKLQKM